MRVIAAALLATFALVAAPAQAKLHRTVTAVPGKPPVVLRSDGVTVTLAPPTQAELDAADAAEEGPPPATHVTVQFPGQPPFEVPADEARLDVHGITVSIGPLAKWAAAVVLLEGFTGGAHCCATFQLVQPWQGGARVLDLPPMDGNISTRFPRDVDGDGTADIERTDDRFLYAFTSYAASWAPPLYYNVGNAGLVDVSAEPRYARRFAAYAAETRKVCTGKSFGRNGACAAYAAAMARLDKADEGLAFASQHAEQSDWLPEPCTVDYDAQGECPEGKTLTFSGFPDALQWMLMDAGYTD